MPDNLAPAFLAQVTAALRRHAARPPGARGRDRSRTAPDALWQREVIEAARVAARAGALRIVVAVDPPATCGRGCRRLRHRRGRARAAGAATCIADASVAGAAPDGWAARRSRSTASFEADALVAEVNQGGDMVAAVIREVDANVPVTSVVATRGK